MAEKKITPKAAKDETKSKTAAAGVQKQTQRLAKKQTAKLSKKLGRH